MPTSAVKAPAPATYLAITPDGDVPVTLIDLTQLKVPESKRSLWFWYQHSAIEDYQHVYKLRIGELEYRAFCAAGIAVTNAWQISGIPDDVYCIIQTELVLDD